MKETNPEPCPKLMRPYYGPDNEDAPPRFGCLSREMWRRFKQGHLSKDIKLALLQYPAVTPDEIAKGLKPKLTLSVVRWQRVEIVPAPILVRFTRDRRSLPPCAKVRLQTFLFDYEDEPDLCYSVWLKRLYGSRELFLECKAAPFEPGQNYEGLELPFSRPTGSIGLPMRFYLRIYGKDRHAYVQMKQQVDTYLRNKCQNKE